MSEIAFMKTQIVPRYNGPVAGVYEAPREGPKTVDEQFEAIHERLDEAAKEGQVQSTLISDVLRGQSRIELSVSALAGYIQSNSKFLQDWCGLQESKDYRRKIIDAVLLCITGVGLLCSGVVAVKVLWHP